MMTDTQQQLSKTTILLHWLVALLMIALLAVGIYMTENKDYSLYGLHKSFGVVVLVLALARVAWRIKNGWPLAAGNYKAWEHKLSHIVHWILIIGTLIMPISGVIMSSMGGHNVPLFGFDLIPANHDPANPQAVLARNAELGEVAEAVHAIVGYLLILCIVLHVAGALKHHIIDKDGTLMRMKGKRIDFNS
ncbi:cytochrome b [Alteromonas lipolytica]|uniref:RNA methyltransferase n=1 Tax=Alteromonas lipolytica TaxID=1856405 RepID=A0A1E8FFQ2_9ALTE|nr:cytochrome b [Alteromonas lipolytica]OFI34739.1 RNA methyltransferase [Alteromonas lipolytica]GGF53619.1 cytochrome b [Alteromonas lipolytica]